MDVFRAIEQSLDDKIAQLEILNDRLRKNKCLLSKTLADKEKAFENHRAKEITINTNRVQSSISSDQSTDTETSISPVEESLESKLDHILAIAKTTRIAPAKPSQQQTKEIDNKKATHNTANTNIGKAAARKPLAAYVPSNGSKLQDKSLSARTTSQKSSLIPSRPVICEDKPSTKQVIPKHEELQKPLKEDSSSFVFEWKSNVVDQLMFFNRNRVLNKYKTQFMPSNKLLQAHMNILSKVNGIVPSVLTSNILFDLILYTFGTSHLPQLMHNLQQMQHRNAHFQEEILTLIHNEGKMIVQKLSKQSLLVKTSLGMDDVALFECWIMGRLLLGLTNYATTNTFTTDTGRVHLHTIELRYNWIRLQNNLKFSLNKAEEIMSKSISRQLIASLYYEKRKVIKNIIKYHSGDILVKLQLLLKEIVAHNRKLHPKQWEPILKCVRVLLSMSFHDGKKINCSILHKTAT